MLIERIYTPPIPVDKKSTKGTLTERGVTLDTKEESKKQEQNPEQEKKETPEQDTIQHAAASSNTTDAGPNHINVVA